MFVSLFNPLKKFVWDFSFDNKKNDTEKKIQKFLNEDIITDKAKRFEFNESGKIDVFSRKNVHTISNQLGLVIVVNAGILVVKRITCPHQTHLLGCLLSVGASFITIGSLQAILLKRKISLDPDQFGEEILRIGKQVALLTLLLASATRLFAITTSYSHAFFEGSCALICTLAAIEFSYEKAKQWEGEYQEKLNSAEYDLEISGKKKEESKQNQPDQWWKKITIISLLKRKPS